MKLWIRAFIVSAAVLASCLAGEQLPAFWRYTAYAAAAITSFVAELWVGGPDGRMQLVRKVNLDLLFDGFFAEARGRVGAGERLPFRANVMERRRTWYLWPRLAMAYSYAMEQSDADYGLAWLWPGGLCWRVCRSAQAEFYDGSPVGGRGFWVTRRQLRATTKVKAIIAIPIRSAHADQPVLRRRVDAVLNIDAISPEAADDLAVQWAEFTADKRKEFVDLVESVRLYF